MDTREFWERVRRQADAALASGALHSFDCALHFVEDAGVEFVVRSATRLPPGETVQGRTSAAPPLPRNPFLAPEPDLVVGEVCGTHLALLNKFNVIREHVVLATLAYADQEALLDQHDFRALASCMTSGIVAFYNGGGAAGASQAHKHLQLVTLPLSPRASVPIEPLFARPLPFRHALDRLAEGDLARPARLHEVYRQLLDRAGIPFRPREGREYHGVPYNLVLTNGWMLVVPRSRDRFEGISINALAFAGSFFVRDERCVHVIAKAKPLSVLEAVTPK